MCMLTAGESGDIIEVAAEVEAEAEAESITSEETAWDGGIFSDDLNDLQNITK